jgi:hypothetical protein
MANDPPTSLGMRFGYPAHREMGVPFRNPRPVSQVNFLIKERKATMEMNALATDHPELCARFIDIARDATARMCTSQDTLERFRKAVASARQFQILKDKIRAARSVANTADTPAAPSLLQVLKEKIRAAQSVA